MFSIFGGGGGSFRHFGLNLGYFYASNKVFDFRMPLDLYFSKNLE